MRALHWVIKSGNLRKTVEFYGFVLGLKVLRHEEFAEGCEATCNGRWGGAWSKTILGKTSETVDFCLEIIYNWGIDMYERGNDFRCLIVGDRNGSKLEKGKKWCETHGEELSSTNSLRDPDGNLIVFNNQIDRDFDFASFNVSDLEKSLEIYTKGFLGKIERQGERSAVIRFGDGSSTGVELIEVSEKIVHLGSQGRFAVETPDGFPDELARRVGPLRVMHGPLQLPPHNERVVVVTDPDLHEFAFVEASGYANCIVAGSREIDWKYREEFARSKRTKKELEKANE